MTRAPGNACGGDGMAASYGRKKRVSYVSLDGLGYARSPPMTSTSPLMQHMISDKNSFTFESRKISLHGLQNTTWLPQPGALHVY